MAFEAALRGRRFTTNPTTISVSGTAAENSSALSPGLYSVTSDVAIHFLQGDSTVTATTSSNPLWTNERVEIEVRVRDGAKDGYISVIKQSGESDGTVYITPIEP